MKKLINLLILFTTILSLTFIPAIQTNAAAKVNITYYAGKGYFKAKPNRSKNKITIKNKINKKRGYVLLSDVMDILLMAGTLRKKVARNIQPPLLSQRNRSFIHIG